MRHFRSALKELFTDENMSPMFSLPPTSGPRPHPRLYMFHLYFPNEREADRVKRILRRFQSSRGSQAANIQFSLVSYTPPFKRD
ncbi:hypothetical protein [Phascolarctid gammaherpesvirus 1]|uniref:Uncharacterized protein n=1 Tax=Phascolarctid gammaherpesvirus 1 TaxID=2249313 RepID=A0A3Q8J4J1_9GAMA|nr:hypothetical protein KM711_gp67 [Phascolarctid gammaherpesvirus 1]AZB49243.1 hypothetical protein [Phascolarctid gammaherpesvirus 1]